jgi:hypothetical protein
MRRVGRFLFAAVSVLSLLLAFATIALWVRSFWVSDAVAWWDAESLIGGGIGVSRGRIAVERYVIAPFARTAVVSKSGEPFYQPKRPPQSWEDGWPAATTVHWSVGGFASISGSYVAVPSIQMWVVPCWFVVLLLMVAPLMTFRRSMRARRVARWRREGRCTVCGYDMRGSAGCCPECGVASEANATELQNSITR